MIPAFYTPPKLAKNRYIKPLLLGYLTLIVTLIFWPGFKPVIDTFVLLATTEVFGAAAIVGFDEGFGVGFTVGDTVGFGVGETVGFGVGDTVGLGFGET